MHLARLFLEVAIMLKRLLFLNIKKCKIISLSIGAFLCLNSSLEAKLSSTFLIPNIIVNFEPHLDSDINYDWKVDINDVALWFNFLADTSLVTRDTILYRGIHLNRDTKYFLYWIFKTDSWVGGGYGPILDHPDSLPEISGLALALADSQLTALKEVKPEWSPGLEAIRRQFGLTGKPPVPLNPDLNGDHLNNISDVALFFIYLADSLRQLPDSNAVLRSLDFNADGVVNYRDCQAFLWRLHYDRFQSQYLYEPPPAPSLVDPSALPALSEKSRYFALRMLSWMHRDGLTRDANGAARALNLPELSDSLIPANQDGDLDRDLRDALLFFEFVSEFEQGQLDTTGLLPRLDMNFNGPLDSLDVDNFLFFLFFKNVPAMVPDRELPRISATSKVFALDWLTREELRHPEWITDERISKCSILREMLSTVPTTKPEICDYDGNGVAEIADLVYMVVLGSQNSPLADKNGDGRFKINDAVIFLNDLRAGRCPTLNTANQFLASAHPAGFPGKTEIQKAFGLISQMELSASERQALAVKFGLQFTKANPTSGFSLGQNSPNPFNPSTAISFNLPEDFQEVNLSVFDIRGRLVINLISGTRSEGAYTVFWNGKDKNGMDLPSGVYFCRLRAGGSAATRKLILLK